MKKSQMLDYMERYLEESGVDIGFCRSFGELMLDSMLELGMMPPEAPHDDGQGGKYQAHLWEPES